MTKRIHLDQGIAQMLHDPQVLETAASKRARERFFFPKPPRERPHLWLPAGRSIGPHSLVYTNDGTVIQSKAHVYELKEPNGSVYYAVIRGLNKVKPGWDLDEVKAWAEMTVQELILEDYEFFG